MWKLKRAAACLLAAAVMAGAVPCTAFATRTADTGEAGHSHIRESRKTPIPESFPDLTQDTWPADTPIEEIMLPALPSTPSKITTKQKIPAAYDSRRLGYVTSVKDQRPWDTCWAFAAAACAETSLIVKGLAAADKIDLSEQHISYFTYHPQTDPPGKYSGRYGAYPFF